MNVRLPRGVAVAIGCCLLPLNLIWTLGPRAAAERTGAQSSGQVLIESVTPAVPKTKSKLVISGRVANNSDSSVLHPGVRLLLSPTPLSARSEVAEVLNGTGGTEGVPVSGTEHSLGQRLAPGQQAEFRISLPFSRLDLGSSAAVHAVFVESLSDGNRIGISGTVLPWFPRGARYRPSGLALAWPIEQLPAVAADELVLDPNLPTELGPRGRLSRLVAAGARNDVSWLVDSATVETAAGMADGYRLDGPDGPSPGDLTDYAKAFVSSLAGALGRGPATLVVYATDDDDSLQRGGLPSFVVRSVSLPEAIADERLPAVATTTVFAPIGGRVDEPTMRALVDAGVRTFVLSDRAFPPDPEVTFTPTGATSVDIAGSRVQILLSDTSLARNLALPLTTAAERSLARQRFLAETAMITLERPEEPRRALALPPALWDPPTDWVKELLSALRTAPWLRLVPLANVPGSGEVTRSKTSYGRSLRKTELPRAYVVRIRELESRLKSLTGIVDDPTGFGETFTLALQRAGSALWRGRVTQRRELIETIGAQLNAEKAKVRVISSGSVTLAGESGVLPLTIANDLDRAVTVGLRLRTANEVRLQYGKPAALTIDARQKTGIEIPVRVVGSEPMEVHIVLTDRHGNAFDSSARLELRSTASSRIAAIVSVIGGVTLLVLVGLRFWRRASRRG